MNMYALYTRVVRVLNHRNGYVMVDFGYAVIILYAFFQKNEKLDIPFRAANR